MKKKSKNKGKTRNVFVSGAIRYIGAFGGYRIPFNKKMEYELNGTDAEKAAVPIKKQEYAILTPCGVLFDKSAIRCTYNADCYSVPLNDGTLVPTRNYNNKIVAGYDWHAECFIKKGSKPIAIVYDKTFYNNKTEYFANLQRFAKMYNIDLVNVLKVNKYLSQRKRGIF